MAIMLYLHVTFLGNSKYIYKVIVLNNGTHVRSRILQLREHFNTSMTYFKKKEIFQGW